MTSLPASSLEKLKRDARALELRCGGYLQREKALRPQSRRRRAVTSPSLSLRTRRTHASVEVKLNEFSRDTDGALPADPESGSPDSQERMHVKELDDYLLQVRHASPAAGRGRER